MLASPYVRIPGWEPSWKQVSEVFPINHKLCTEIDLLVSPTECSLFLFLPEDGNRIKGSVISESFWNRCCSSFPGSSAGKESACNAGDPSLIPGLERSTGEGIGSPLRYSWASLVVQLIKKPPAMWDTWVRLLGWEDPLEEGTGYSLQYSGLENSMNCIVRGITKSQTWVSDFHFQTSHSWSHRLSHLSLQRYLNGV